MSVHRVLLVEDQSDWMDIYRANLQTGDFEIFEATSLEEALVKLQNNEFAVVFTDLKLLDADAGFEILKRAKTVNPYTQVVIVTAFGSEQYAMAATRQGALDYVTKPVDFEKLNYVIKNGIRVYEQLVTAKPTQVSHQAQQNDETDTLVEQITLIGNSPSMKQVQTYIAQAAETSVPVLIIGQLGTGKEHIAKSIHFNSARHAKPYGSIACEDLGRLQTRAYIRLLSLRGGTLFLDNLHALTKDTVAIAFEAMRRCQTLDVRVIAASQIGASELRQFLYTLNVLIDVSQIFDDSTIGIWVPPLRMRKEGDDIASLAGHFLREFQDSLGIDDRAISVLQDLDYTNGNVRELRHLLRTSAEQVQREGGNTIFRQHILASLSKLAQPEPVENATQVFVSYSSRDRDFVRKLLTRCSSYNLDFWIDYERIPYGSQFWDRDIEKGLESSEVMLLISSPNSMSSDEVAREWNYFLSRKKPILMLVYQEAKIPYRLEPIQLVQYSTQSEDKIGNIIINALENLLKYS